MLRLRRRTLWTLAALALLAAAALLAATLVLPGWLRGWLEQQGSAQLGRGLHIESLELRPLTLSLTLHRVRIDAVPGAADAAPLLRIERLHADAQWRSLWARAPVIEALSIDAPRLRLARLADGRYDIDDLIARFAAAPAAPDAAAAPARFALHNLVLRDGELQFDDRPVGRTHRIERLQLVLPFVSRFDADAQAAVEPRLAFSLDGTAVDSRASAHPFTAAPDGTLSLDLAGLSLPAWQPYLPAAVPLRLAGGRLDARLSLQFSRPAAKQPLLALRGELTLSDLELQQRDGTPLLRGRRLQLPITELQPLARRANFGVFSAEGLALALARDARGRLLLPGRADTDAAPAAPAPAVPDSSPGRAWQVRFERIALRDGRLLWQDGTTRPAARLALQDIALTLEQPQWPLRAPLPLQLSAQLADLPPGQGRLALDGRAGTDAGELALRVDRLPLAAGAPYLATLLRPQLRGELSAEGRLRWDGAPAEHGQLQLVRLRLDQPALVDPRAPRQPLAALAALELGDAELDPARRTLRVRRLSLQQPQLALRRDAGGPWNAEQWLVPSAPAPQRPAVRTAATAPGPDWQLQLGELRLDGGRLRIDDAATGAQPVALQVQALALRAQQLRWPLRRGAPAVPWQLSAQVQPADAAAGAVPGRLNGRGQWRAEPMTLASQWRIERLPLQALAPYLAAQLPFEVLRAQAGWRGEVELVRSAAGWRVAARGDALLADWHLATRRGNDEIAAGEDGDELLSWQSLALQGLQLALAPGEPPRVQLAEVALSDFFASLVLDERGRLNLQRMARPAGGAGASDAASPTLPPATPPTSAEPPAPTAAAAPATALPLAVVVERTRLLNGRIDFHDHFVQPNYRADLSALNGTLGRIDGERPELAALELRGRAAGSGLLEVLGSVNPLRRPPVLDLRARATDLELAPLSTYSGKYVGYAIERGKLTMDVHYRVEPDGRLQASNQIVLNQLTLGDPVDSPDATKLPVRLALALLQDRHGVIDINLPISGSLNDPQFSVGGIVVKLIVNLIAKALTAPFALLGGGGGPDLSFAEFQPGTALLNEAGRGTIDQVARALADRPALQMTVTGAADPVAEREAMQAAALEARLLAEHRRERLRDGAAADAPLAPPTAAERERLLRRLYADSRLPDKPRNLIGLAKDLPPAETAARLRAAQPVNTDTARELALQRGLAVRDALIAAGLPSERLFLATPRLRASGEDDGAWTPRVQLSLQAP